MSTTALVSTQGASACTTALGNPDILGHIFSFVLPAYAPVFSDLEHLAFICKDFLEQILNYTWAQLGSLLPLLSILPAFQISGSRHGICGTVSEAEWSRFHYYSRRVKVLFYLPVGGPLGRVSPSASLRLAQLRSKPLLPALRQLVVVAYEELDLPWMYLGLTPTLETVHIAGAKNVSSEETGFFLSAVADNVPALSAFTFGTQQHQEGKALSSVSRLLNLHDLKIIGMPCPDNLFRQMGNMTNLTNLSIELSTIPIDLLDTPFDSLRQLSISSPLNIINNILQQLSAPRLASLTMSATPPLQGHLTRKQMLHCLPSLRDCLSTLVNQWYKTLKELVITDTCNWNQPEGTADFVDPLTRLDKLEHVDLRPAKLALSYDNLFTIGACHCWPKITHLSLPWPGEHHTKALTLHELGTLAELCPLLDYLQIYLDVSFVQPFVPRPPTFSQLRTLSVGSATGLEGINETLKVARLLDHYFHFLQEIEGHESHNKRSWCQIMDVIRVFRSVRAEPSRD
ncbi:hypothetical protein BDN72DRAFT_838864 [Pluteus cervinus]|uniref:Uncharacterized protein n=1 Tax=Pluteus cervinus TaxID=181527 RepID=A0ACD3AXH0_9AGAR|nr:hypothetical protein BDN72DRAFT_838864 [Pluteus cervinus]